MRYWVLRGRDIIGPYPKEALRTLPGFGAKTIVAPDGTKFLILGRADSDFRFSVLEIDAEHVPNIRY